MLLTLFVQPPEKEEGSDKESNTPHLGGSTDGHTELTKSLGSDADIGRADRSHEKGRYQRKPEIPGFTLALGQPNGEGPQGNGGQRLIGPGKVAPDDLKALRIAQTEDEQRNGDEKKWHAKQQPLADGTLRDVEEIGQDETG